MSKPCEIFRHSARRFVPWRNGGGRTAEILASPAGAGFDDFSWRISTAEVAASGPFSVFPGVQRCLTVLEGGSLRLCFADGVHHDVSPGAAPVYFAGGVPCSCELHGAPVLDLNVMVRPPLRALVCRLDDAVTEHPSVLRRLLFALEDLPALGLERYDLADMTAEPLPRSAHALLIDIMAGI